MIDFNEKRRFNSIILVLISSSIIIFFLIINSYNHEKSPMPILKENIHIDSKARYTVSSGTKESAAVASNILEEGGNAIDAAIALSFSLAVTAPQSNGIGGGGVMLIYDPSTDQSIYYDFYNSSGNIQTDNQIGIPGFLRGMEHVYTDYATKNITELINPAIEQAEKGFYVSKKLNDSIQTTPFISETNSDFSNKGKLYKTGDLLVQPTLANTLKEVRNNGFDILYDGEHEISQNFMTLSGYNVESLSSYESIKYDALQTSSQGEQIYAAGSPFSGATAIQLYKLLNDSSLAYKEGLTGEDLMNYDEIFNFTHEQNRKYIGDMDSSRINEREIIENDYLLEYYKNDDNYDEDFNESENTISYTIIDHGGLVVSGTNTLSNEWGSTLSSDGIIYNNSVKNFSSSESNKWEPMKRPKTFMSPMIVSKDGNFIAISAAGGNTIPQVISTILSMNTKSEISLNDAINTQRFAKQRGRYTVESKNTRNNRMIYKGSEIYDLRYLKEGGFFSTVTISSKIDNHYESFYDKIACDEECTISTNIKK